VAFVSTRAGPPQIYVMGVDGTDQELLASFDFGSTGPSNAPEWSPDGASVVFHREVSRSPQIFILDVASQRVKQLTSVGRNEDPTWAPDGRHVAFVSDRTGRRQIWIVDTETGRVRQLNTAGAARLPSWSRRLRGAGSNP
jgi:TolB protein